MPEPGETGTLTIHANRGGTVPEISAFLGDLEAAYLCLYQFESLWPAMPRSRRLPFFFERGFPFSAIPLPPSVPASDAILPELRLVITRVQIESPGFWEVLGSLNPLQQIREYLNDRHRRRQDREYREAAEKEKLRLENELIQRQIWEKENAVLRDRINLAKELGYSDHEVRQLVWTRVGKPLAMLGRHQDTGLIEGAS